AIADFNRAIEINPNFATAYCHRGNARYFLGDYEGAIADHNQALQLDPNLAQSYHSRGNAYFALENYDKAIADYIQTIKISTQLADNINIDIANAYHNRGVACFEHGA
ncbi:MAG: tetratricopeptide repeat protein, partial [Nostoc sp.]